MGESGVQLASIFRRGGHKQELLGNDVLPEQQELSEQLRQLAVAWSLPKARKGMGVAVWRPLLGAFEVVKRGSNQFHGQGFIWHKKLYLNVEEAVYLMDQGAIELLLSYDDGPDQQGGGMQQQQQQQQQQQLSMQEALHMMVSLGVSHERLQVLSHLCRLGYHVKRHPACWHMSGDLEHPATAWQQSTAWTQTDGLPLMIQQQPLAAAAAAVAGGAAALQQSAASSDAAEGPLQQPRQQQQQEHLPDVAAPPAAVNRSNHKCKRRRIDGAADQQPDDESQQQQIAQDGVWWAKQPHWLTAAAAATTPEATPPPAAAAAAVDHPYRSTDLDLRDFRSSTDDGLDRLDLVHMLLGLQLQQQFPNLEPLPTYKGVPQQQQAQQQQQNAFRAQEAVHSDTATHDLVYDALPVDANFSHYKPPTPQLSIAMPRPGCHHIPQLEELLRLVDAAAAEGQQSAAKGVMFGMPDGGDVNFYEIRPVELMNMLTNGR